jgi:hypothetical protein
MVAAIVRCVAFSMLSHSLDLGNEHGIDVDVGSKTRFGWWDSPGPTSQS